MLPNIPIDLPLEELKETLLNALNDIRSPLQDGYGVYEAPKAVGVKSRARRFTGETKLQVGDAVKITYDPKLKTGFIDVKGVEGLDMKDLKAQFDKVREALPKGIWELNPGKEEDAVGAVIDRADLKHKLYKKIKTLK